MMLADKIARLAAVTVILVVLQFPADDPYAAQCRDKAFASANPGLCSNAPWGMGGGGNGEPPAGGGGGGSGGLIGGILHKIGGLL